MGIEIKIDNIEQLCDLMCSNIITEQIQRCKVCNRRLKNKQAKELGMGKTCYKKYMELHTHKKLF